MLKVKPKVYFIGSTTINKEGLEVYLRETGNEEFLDILTGVDMMDIVSFYAKLCYKSLSLGKNRNVSKVRDIAENFMGIISSTHGSCLEHSYVNFVAENVSRIETTEQIRHRIGTSYSGESGRYSYSDNLKIWTPSIADKYPILKDSIHEVVQFCEDKMNEVYNQLIDKCENFADKKILTSAIRRMKPLGCAETLGFGINLRSARHTIELRTSKHAEEEIRIVFGQVAEFLKKEIPLLFFDCKEEMVDGHLEYSFENKKI
jgi:thymidylate synthase (FAD)